MLAMLKADTTSESSMLLSFYLSEIVSLHCSAAGRGGVFF